jgi:hypothetical protein
LPDNRRRRVVLPAPFAGFGQSIMLHGKKCDSPPIRRVRLPAGRLMATFWRPSEPSWNLYERFWTSMLGRVLDMMGVSNSWREWEQMRRMNELKEAAMVMKDESFH